MLAVCAMVFSARWTCFYVEPLSPLSTDYYASMFSYNCGYKCGLVYSVGHARALCAVGAIATYVFMGAVCAVGKTDLPLASCCMCLVLYVLYSEFICVLYVYMCVYFISLYL